MLMTDPTASFRSPVRCLRCHQGVYDLAAVTVTARYTDCSVWKAPCCGATVDDRGETGWKSFKDYERIDGDLPARSVYGLPIHYRPLR